MSGIISRHLLTVRKYDINLVFGVVLPKHCVSDFCKRFDSGFQLNMLRWFLPLNITLLVPTDRLYLKAITTTQEKKKEKKIHYLRLSRN